MSQLGWKPMVYFLRGGTEHSASEYYGREIVAASLEDNSLHLTFSDSTRIRLWDDAQSGDYPITHCCEDRYISCDDDVQSLVGSKLTGIYVKDGPKEENEDGCHEVAFVEIQTDKGLITLANHNEHNGYYGGFALNIREIKPR